MQNCPLGILRPTTLVKVGAGYESGAGGERRTRLSGEGCRLLRLLHVNWRTLDVMDDHRGRGHHLGSDGGVLGLEWG